ncbi:MAG: GvpL/GvpF family gas vesicle protein, partial [Dehalococcoidia bacterium]
QISWDPEVIGQRLTRTGHDLATLTEEIRSKAGGTAYLNREKLKDLLRREMEAEANRCAQDFYSRIREHVDDLRVDRTKKGEKGQQMILNLSCLVSKEQTSDLGQELELITNMEGFIARFTGPWPPYSFVGGV